MNEDRLFHETEKQKELSIKREFVLFAWAKHSYKYTKKDEKHKLTSSHGTYCIHKG